MIVLMSKFIRTVSGKDGILYQRKDRIVDNPIQKLTYHGGGKMKDVLDEISWKHTESKSILLNKHALRLCIKDSMLYHFKQNRLLTVVEEWLKNHLFEERETIGRLTFLVRARQSKARTSTQILKNLLDHYGDDLSTVVKIDKLKKKLQDGSKRKGY